MNNQERFNRLNQMIADGLIIRNEWTNRDSQGRERACLLAALSPEVVKQQNPDFCPASLMPRWLAHLTPWIDDNVSNAYWPEMVKEYAWMISKIHLLNEEKINQLNYECRLFAVLEARSHISEIEHDLLKVIDDVISLLKRVLKGELVLEEEWETTRKVAEKWEIARRILRDNREISEGITQLIVIPMTVIYIVKLATIPVTMDIIIEAMWMESRRISSESSTDRIVKKMFSSLWMESRRISSESSTDRIVKKMFSSFRREIEVLIKN